MNYSYLANIWATNNLAGIVTSVKILALKFLSFGFFDSLSRNHKFGVDDFISTFIAI